MPLKIAKTTTIDVSAATVDGSIEIAAKVAGDEKIDKVSLGLSVFKYDGETTLTVSAVDIERAAKLLDQLRQEIGDFRAVCVEHGYYRGGRCDACAAPAEAVAVPAPASPTLNF